MNKTIIEITYIDTPRQRYLPVYENMKTVKLYPVIKTIQV